MNNNNNNNTTAQSENPKQKSNSSLEMWNYFLKLSTLSVK